MVYQIDLKTKRNCPVTCDDILIKQSHSIIFPSKGVEVTNKVYLTKFTKTKQILTKKSVPQSGDLEVNNFRCLKTNFEASKTTYVLHCCLVLYVEFSIISP